MKEKKKFKETKFGSFLNKAGGAIKENGGDVAGIVLKAATGNISGAIGDTIEVLRGGSSEETKELLTELKLRQEEIELDFYRAEIADRDSARNREIEIAKTGNTDWMLYSVGGTILLSFIATVVVILSGTPTSDSKMLHLVVGEVMSLVSLIVGYYFGSSRGSKDKQETIDILSETFR